MALYGAFKATLQGKPAAQKNDPRNLQKGQQKTEKKAKTCLCGEIGSYKDCKYLNEAKRPANWQGNSVIQQAINDKLDQNPSLKAFIKRIIEVENSGFSNPGPTNNQSDALQSALPAAFTTIVMNTDQSKPNTVGSETIKAKDRGCKLMNSFILNSGATIYVCNSTNRMYDLSQTNGEILYAGNSVCERSEDLSVALAYGLADSLFSGHLTNRI